MENTDTAGPSNMESVPVDIGNGIKIRVEATPLAPRGGIGRPKDISSIQEDLHFDEIAAAIKQISAVMIGALEQAKPTKASVEFGIEVGVESGKLTALLVKGNAKGNLKISLEWAK